MPGAGHSVEHRSRDQRRSDELPGTRSGAPKSVSLWASVSPNRVLILVIPELDYGKSSCTDSEVNDPEAERRLRLCRASPLKHLLDASTVLNSPLSAFYTLFT